MLKTEANVPRLPLGEQRTNVGRIIGIQSWLPPDNNVEISNRRHYSVIEALLSLQEPSKSLGIDLCNLGQPNPERPRPLVDQGREGELLGIGLAERKRPRSEHVLSSVIDSTRRENLWSKLGLQSVDQLHVESKWENLIGWQNNNVVVVDGFSTPGDDRRVLGRFTTLTGIAPTTVACAVSLTSRISTRRCH